MTSFKVEIGWAADPDNADGILDAWVDMWLGYEVIGAYKLHTGAKHWSAVFVNSAADIPDDRLPVDMTEEQVREHMTLKYILLRGG